MHCRTIVLGGAGAAAMFGPVQEFFQGKSPTVTEGSGLISELICHPHARRAYVVMHGDARQVSRLTTVAGRSRGPSGYVPLL